MTPLSCANCCFNGLQFGTLGLSAGYCVEHRLVLRRSDETTCARQLRKDLGRQSAEAEQRRHRVRFNDDVVYVRSQEPAETGIAIGSNGEVDLLEQDRVGEVVANYGNLGSKIASLSQLRAISGIRAEFAMLSLARSYVRRCVAKGGAWTSGLHLVWWTRSRLADRPEVGVSDLRVQSSTTMDRQAELAAWSVVMLRLNFISDVGSFAPQNEPMSRVSNLVEEAAEATEVPDLASLLEWVRSVGIPQLDTALPKARYQELKESLRRERGDAPE